MKNYSIKLLIYSEIVNLDKYVEEMNININNVNVVINGGVNGSINGDIKLKKCHQYFK